ncbi:putative Predicted acyltransferase 3 [Planktothrix serta PCC 8927]|uniref:Predicted acyltransferase 3 n=1 Tax=Planktothrix serta PCC 8927 TaxID=671068 RepID=A0A7Z9BQZ5_9CYAN|nr:acyltransferase [Planktothrix serta]VXD20389.1 putative Predicted acyltransferase 3 [Planktothrix serta PCC 8927]
MNNRLIVFDLLRCLAIFIILVHHFLEYLSYFYNSNFIGINVNLLFYLNELNRYLGLGLFTFVSGYLINLKRERFKDLNSALKFLYKKFLRIFPLYYLALITFIYMDKIFSPLKIAIHILGLQLLFSSSNFQPIKTLWFIGLILIYYCLFIVINFRNIIPIYRIFIIILFPIVLGGLSVVFGVTDLRLILYYWIFIFGIFCAENNFFEQQFWRKISPINPILFLFIFLIAFFVEIKYGLMEINLVYSYILITILELLFVLLVYQISSLIPIKNSLLKLIQVISYSSYCMFLFHRPLWFVMENLLQQTLEINNFYIMISISTLLAIPILITFSYFLQHFYDKYFMKLAYSYWVTSGKVKVK